MNAWQFTGILLVGAGFAMIGVSISHDDVTAAFIGFVLSLLSVVCAVVGGRVQRRVR